MLHVQHEAMRMAADRRQNANSIGGLLAAAVTVQRYHMCYIIYFEKAFKLPLDGALWPTVPRSCHGIIFRPEARLVPVGFKFEDALQHQGCHDR